MTRACDAKCFELATYFLEEEGLTTTPQTLFELACDMQELIENYIDVAKAERGEG